MNIKTRRQIYLECCFPKSYNVKKLDLNEEFIGLHRVLGAVKWVQRQLEQRGYDMSNHDMLQLVNRGFAPLLKEKCDICGDVPHTCDTCAEEAKR